MKNKLTILILMSFWFILGCDSNDGYYITNNVLEAEIINIQSEVPGKIIFNKLERGIHVARGEIILIIDTTLIVRDKEVLMSRLNGLDAKEEILRANGKLLRQNIKYFTDQSQKWGRLAKNQAGPQQTADDFNHQLQVAKLKFAELNEQIKAITPERTGLNAQLNKIRETISKHSIKAPVAGQIVDKFVHAGEIVSPGKPLGQLTDPTKLHVYLYWPIDMMSRFKLESKVELFVDGGEAPYSGVISWVSPIAEFTPKIVQSAENRAQMVYQVRIEVVNEEETLKIGQPIEARLPWIETDDKD